MSISKYKIARAGLVFAAFFIAPIAILKIVEVITPDKIPVATTSNALENRIGTPIEYKKWPKKEEIKEDDINFVKDYSPGNGEWKLPTEEERRKQDYDLYVVTLEEWAKPQLDSWTCKACNQMLSKEFNFKSRNNNIIKFECRCRCGHTHIISLQGKQ